MPAIRKFVVTPDLPTPLRPLLDIARNVWWTWNVEAINLLRRVDPDGWDRHDGNPIAVLGSLAADRIRELERDKAFLAHLERVRGDLERYLAMPAWFESENENLGKTLIGYFSLEFGLHESLPLYSGGLGILAGDHLKSASDLGLPLVGVGLAYQYGYFRQYLNHDGWQMEEYPVNDFYNMSMQLERDPEGKPWVIEVHYPGRTVRARIWRVQVGRNPLLLLDTNLPENLPEDREITSRLYGGDNDMRIRQEIMLGIGGLRALMTLGLEPDVCHLNEGHSAFLALERINLLMKNRGLDYATAFEMVRASNVFTTHTPVPAGNDHFAPELVTNYLKSKADELGIGIEGLLSLGRQNPADKQRDLLHDGAGPAPEPLRQRRQRAARPCVARTCGSGFGPACRPRRSPSPTSPTASTPAAGCARRSPACTNATWARAGTRSPPTAPSGTASTTSPTPSSGARTNACASGWSASCAGACASSCRPAAPTGPGCARPRRCSTPKP